MNEEKKLPCIRSSSPSLIVVSSQGKKMAQPPTYQELQERVKKLEIELAQQRAGAETTDTTLNHLKLISTIFDIIPNPVFYKNRQGIYLGCNQAFSEIILGISKQQVIGCSLYDLPDRIPKKLADIYHNQDQALFDNPGKQIYETKVHCADSTLRDFIFYKSTYTDHRGHIAGILGLMLDVTEKNRFQMELAESDEKYRAMMESMRDPVYICSSDLRITYMNPQMIADVGKDAIGEHCHAVLHNLEEPCSWCCFDRVKQGEVVEMEVNSLKNQKIYLVTSSPIIHQDQTVSKMTVYRDITKRKQMEQELLMAKKIEAAGVFASGIAHDYNNLLFIVLGNLLMLKREPDCEEREELLHAAEDAAQKATQLTSKLLNFTHGKPLNICNRNIKQLIGTVIANLQEEASCEIELQFTDNLPKIPIDSELISIACKNILKNSIQAMKDHGKILISADMINIEETSPEIQQGLLSHKGCYLKIIFSDNGPGIDKEILPKIFDPYFSTMDLPTNKGLGMGLAISYSIVRKHHGTMTAASFPGQGTSVTILIPAITNSTAHNT